MTTLVGNIPHFYFRPGQTQGADALLATAVGLTHAHWEECRRLASLLPPPDGDAQGALGLFRGQTLEFILAHAYLDGGQPLVHYLLMPTDVVRQLAGRPTLLSSLLVASRAVPAAGAGAIPALEWPLPAAPTVEEQSSDLSEVMFQVNDNPQVIEMLLSALILGRQTVVIHAPANLETRLAFVQGLLSLLPVPARYGVTYATSLSQIKPGQVQIAFLEADAVPDGAIGYDWQSRKLSGERPEEPYSRFIVQQLRLDPTLAVEQMVALTKTAAWRLRQGETLATALGWAARRVALDMAVTEGQPADVQLVAKALAEDETLSSDLRIAYSRHVLAFMLALEDWTHAGLVGRIAVNDDDVAAGVGALLDTALDEGKARGVFNLVSHWVDTGSGPSSSNWLRRARLAVLTQLRQLSASHDAAGAADFLGMVTQANPALMLTPAIPEIIDSVLPLAAESPAIAERSLVLAAEHLPASAFQIVAQRLDAAGQLPARFHALMAHLQPGLPTAAPAGLLADGAAACGEAHELVLLGRVTEWALSLDRPDLIDIRALARLLALAQSPLQARFAETLRAAVDAVSASGLLTVLEPHGPRLLGEILLVLGDYRAVVALLERVSTTLFRGDAQAEYGPWVSRLFAETRLPGATLVDAVQTITRQGLKPVPTVMAYQGALTGREFDTTLEPLVEGLASRLIADGHLVRLVGVDLGLRLVQYYARKQDADRAVSLAAVITNSLEGAEEGLQTVGRLWAMLNWNDDVREAALELLRRYVRQVPTERARKLPELVTRRLGQHNGDMIQATLVMSIISGGAGLEGLAEDLRIASGLLLDIVSTYEQDKPPTIHRLRSDLDGLSGGVTDDELEAIGQDFLAVARLVWDLGGQDLRLRGSDRTATLLSNTAAPRTGLEALIWLGAYLSKGAPLALETRRETLLHLLGDRSVSMILTEVRTTRSLLERLSQAFGTNSQLRVTLPAFSAEVESLWEGMRLADQRQMGTDLARNAQGFPGLVRRIAEKGSDRALESSGLGRNLERARREPRSALEALRLLHGYFTRQF